MMSTSPQSIITNTTITSPTPETLPSLTRLTRTLLPINYPTKFFTSLLQPLSPENNFSLAKVAIWHDTTTTTTTAEDSNPGQVVGGICGRIVYNPGTKPAEAECELYLATLAVLAPWRGHGIAAALLKEIISAAVEFTTSIPTGEEAPGSVSGPGLGRLRGVFAHVWETNDAGLEWYRGRGFEVGDVVRGYYRKLRPDGARVVRRDVLGFLVEGGMGSE